MVPRAAAAAAVPIRAGASNGPSWRASSRAGVVWRALGRGVKSVSARLERLRNPRTEGYERLFGSDDGVDEDDEFSGASFVCFRWMFITTMALCSSKVAKATTTRVTVVLRAMV